jgi:TatD DNase family protein
MLIDAHAHLDHYAAAELPQVLAELEALPVLTLSVAMDPASYQRTCRLAERTTWILPTFGVHPWHAPAHAHALDALQPLIDASPMLGEIGLDYHWVDDRSAYAAQRTVLDFFLQAARAQDKIVNLHTKGAEAEVLALLAHYAIERAIVHWYSGPLETALALAARGVWFTIGVELHTSAVIQEVARRLPLAQLLTETDNPGGLQWLTGERGMPRHLLSVIEALARLRGVTAAEMQSLIRRNMGRLVAGDSRLTAVHARLTSVADGWRLPSVQDRT